MTAKELDAMVRNLREKHPEMCKRRWELQRYIADLAEAFGKAGKEQLMNDLIEAYKEIDQIETNDLVTLETFR